jgi:histidinol-phosphate aminotransferase
MRKIHSDSRNHLKELGSQASGMPGSGTNPERARQLHLNVNHFTDTKYIFYPSDENPTLCRRYIEFLKYEAALKGFQKEESLSFLTPEHLFFLSVSESIDLLIRTFCEPGKDVVCITNPTFPLYAYCSANHGALIVDVPLQGENLDIMDLSKIQKLNPKVTFVASPNNPTGRIMQPAQLLDLAKMRQGILVIDEAYIEFSDCPSFVEQVQEFKNLVILRSFSKIWGLAGIRSGVAIGDPDLIFTLKRMMTPCHFPSHTQKVLETALQDFHSILRSRACVQRERKKLEEEISALAITEKVYPSEANFLLIKFKNARFVHQKLQDQRILVRDTSFVIENTLRISLGSEEDNQFLIKILKQI